MARKVSKNTQRGALSMKTTLIVVFSGVLITGAALAFGVFDKGQIDVSQAIRDANLAAQANSEDGTVPRVISDTRPTQPNGGLVPSGVPVATPEPEPEVEGAASSTEESLEAGDGDEVEKLEEAEEEAPEE